MFIIQINSYLANQSHIVHWNQNLCQKVTGKKFLETKALVIFWSPRTFLAVICNQSQIVLYFTLTHISCYTLLYFNQSHIVLYFTLTYISYYTLLYFNQSHIVLYFTLTHISCYTLLYFNYIFYTLYCTVQCCPSV